MRNVWAVCRTTYREWLLRPQTLAVIPVLLFFYINVTEPMLYYAAVMHTPVNLIEPYLCILNSYAAVPLLPLTCLFLFAGYPRLTGSTVLQLVRTGKRTWFLGQCLFLLTGICTLLAGIFLFSCLCAAPGAYLANGWSTAVRQIHNAEYSTLKMQSVLAVIDRSVLSQIRPYPALLLCTLLQMLYMSIAALTDFCLTLHGHKLLGVLVNLTCAGLGLFLLLSEAAFKWVMPAAHAVFAWHCDSVLDRVYMPVWGSLTYDAVLIAVLFVHGLCQVRRCSLMTVLHL